MNLSPFKDAEGNWDIAYISLGVVTGLLLFAATNMVGLVWADWWTCAPRVILPTADAPNIAVTVISCKPDVLGLGQAFGLAAGAFSTALLALAAYMAATRAPRHTTTTTVVTEGSPAPPAPPAPPGPLPIAVVSMPDEGAADGDKAQDDKPTKATRGNRTKH